MKLLVKWKFQVQTKNRQGTQYHEVAFLNSFHRRIILEKFVNGGDLPLQQILTHLQSGLLHLLRFSSDGEAWTTIGTNAILNAELTSGCVKDLSRYDNV